jgi:hypothetical protein
MPYFQLLLTLNLTEIYALPICVENILRMGVSCISETRPLTGTSTGHISWGGGGGEGG